MMMLIPVTSLKYYRNLFKCALQHQQYLIAFFKTVTDLIATGETRNFVALMPQWTF